MKKINLLILFLFNVIIFSGEIKAQATLGVVFASYPDTVVYGNNYNLEIVIQNKGDQPYSGNIYLNYITNNIIQDTVLDSLLFVSLNPLDTVSFFINNYQFSPPAFLYGGNIVVVWPTGSVATSDSASVPVYVINDTGINNETGNNYNRIKVFPNPVKNELFINCPGFENSIEQVRIYNITGKEIFKSSKNIRSVNTGNYEHGLYFLELQLKDGSQITKQFIKSSSW